MAKVNESTPSGTRVYLVNNHGEVEVTRTRSEPWRLGHGVLVVLVEGRTGGWECDRLTVATEPDAHAEAVAVLDRLLARDETDACCSNDFDTHKKAAQRLPGLRAARAALVAAGGEGPTAKGRGR